MAKASNRQEILTRWVAIRDEVAAANANGTPPTAAQLRAWHAARADLVKANQGLVYQVLRRLPHTPENQEDLAQEGNIGLLIAAERYSPANGATFGTYATFWIFQAITRWLTNHSRAVRVPVRRHTEIHQLRRALRDNPADPAAQAALAKAKERFRHTVSLHGPVNGTDPILEDTLESDTPPPTDDLVAKDTAAQAEALLLTLTPREERIVRLRFGLYDGSPHTLDAIGALMGLTRERIRQIEAKALRKMKAAGLRKCQRARSLRPQSQQASRR